MLLGWFSWYFSYCVDKKLKGTVVFDEESLACESRNQKTKMQRKTNYYFISNSHLRHGVFIYIIQEILNSHRK